MLPHPPYSERIHKFQHCRPVDALDATTMGHLSNVFEEFSKALETALPGDLLQIEHIPGHTQEPFNDMVDWLAKKEREKSFYCQRQKISLTTWRRILPHFWTFFSVADWLAAEMHCRAPCLCTLSATSSQAFPV